MADEFENAGMDIHNLKSLSASRRGKLGSCTRKMNEIRALVDANEHVETVKEGLDEFKRALNDFKKAHEYVQNLLQEDVKEMERVDWYEPKMVTFNDFLHEVDVWANAHYDPQTSVQPNDSISNVSRSSVSSRASKGDRGSRVSSNTSKISSTRVKVAAEKAALLAKAEALKRKHILEREKTELQTKMEALELEADIAATDAKLKVLELHETQSDVNSLHTPRETFRPGNGMNDYLKQHLAAKSSDLNGAETTLSPLHFKDLGAVPKTPLQKFVYKPLEDQDNAHLIQQPSAVQFSGNIHQSTVPIVSSSQHAATQRSASHHSADNVDITNIMKRQCDLADLLVNQQRQAGLPKKEIPVFDGDPLKYKLFMRAFKYNIEDKTSSNQDRLCFLEQYTTGKPKDLVQSCLHMTADRGYKEAMGLLECYFGDEFKIISAYTEKALNWNSIPPDDGKELQNYALFLRGCCNAAQDLSNISELDLPSNLKMIASKLPYKLRENWRSSAYMTYGN